MITDETKIQDQSNILFYIKLGVRNVNVTHGTDENGYPRVAVRYHLTAKRDLGRYLKRWN